MGLTRIYELGARPLTASDDGAFCSQPYVPTRHRLTDAVTRAAGIVRLGAALMLDATVAVSRLAPRF